MRQWIIPLLLAAAVVGSALTLAARSIQSPLSIPTAAREAPSAPAARNGGPPSPDTSPEVSRAAAAPIARPSGVYKCLSASGVTYSDRPCSDTAAPLDLKESRGFDYRPPAQAVSPARVAASTQPAARSSVPAAPVSHAIECDALNKEVEAIDAQARQPQGAWMQDLLKQRRATARSRTYELRC